MDLSLLHNNIHVLRTGRAHHVKLFCMLTSK